MTKKRLELLDDGDGWAILPELILWLSQVSIDYCFKMLFWSNLGSCEVTIGQPFLFQSLASQREIDPENTADLMPVIMLLHQNATRITVSRSGQMRIEFEDGSLIQSDAHDKYEAWTITTSSGGRAIARPGGGVDFWESRLPPDQ
jgi:hypothetical protein